MEFLILNCLQYLLNNFHNAISDNERLDYTQKFNLVLDELSFYVDLSIEEHESTRNRILELIGSLPFEEELDPNLII